MVAQQEKWFSASAGASCIKWMRWIIASLGAAVESCSDLVYEP